MAEDTSKQKPVPLSEVKNILNKISKEREDLLYEQRIALEHAQLFAKLPANKINDLIKELSELDFLKENQVYKIADILPINEDDVKTIFAKERSSLSKDEIKKIIDIVGKYYVK